MSIVMDGWMNEWIDWQSWSTEHNMYRDNDFICNNASFLQNEGLKIGTKSEGKRRNSYNIQNINILTFL